MDGHIVLCSAKRGIQVQANHPVVLYLTVVQFSISVVWWLLLASGRAQHPKNTNNNLASNNDFQVKSATLIYDGL